MRRMLSAICHFVLGALPSQTPCNATYPRDGAYDADEPICVGKIRYHRGLRHA